VGGTRAGHILEGGTDIGQDQSEQFLLSLWSQPSWRDDFRASGQHILHMGLAETGLI